MKTKKNDCLIKIIGTQIVDGETEVVEITTKGSFHFDEDIIHIEYWESEATGFSGSETSVVYEPQDGRITMNRSGKESSQLIIEKSKRHQCLYSTPYGRFTIGVFGKNIDSSLTQDGGDITFSYDLDVETSLASENSVEIQVSMQS